MTRPETLQHADDLAQRVLGVDHLPDLARNAARSDAEFLHLAAAYHHLRKADDKGEYHDLAGRRSIQVRAEERLGEMVDLDLDADPSEVEA